MVKARMKTHPFFLALCSLSYTVLPGVADGPSRRPRVPGTRSPCLPGPLLPPAPALPSVSWTGLSFSSGGQDKGSLLCALPLSALLPQGTL